MTDPDALTPPPGGRSKLALIAAAVAAMVATVAPVTSHFEGLRTKPNRDPVGVMQVCFGETAVPMKEYSPAECKAFLAKRMTRDFAPMVMNAVPGIWQHKGPFAASTDFAYNVGQLRNTSMGRAFRAGQWAKGCEAFLLYRFARDRRTGQMVELPGLAKRRQCERALCNEDRAAIAKLCPAGTRLH